MNNDHTLGPVEWNVDSYDAECSCGATWSGSRVSIAAAHEYHAEQLAHVEELRAIVNEGRESGGS